MLSESVLKIDVCRYLEENWPLDVWRVITAKIKNKILYFYMLILLFMSCVMMLQF